MRFRKDVEDRSDQQTQVVPSSFSNADSPSSEFSTWFPPVQPHISRSFPSTDHALMARGSRRRFNHKPIFTPTHSTIRHTFCRYNNSTRPQELLLVNVYDLPNPTKLLYNTHLDAYEFNDFPRDHTFIRLNAQGFNKSSLHFARGENSVTTSQTEASFHTAHSLDKIALLVGVRLPSSQYFRPSWNQPKPTEQDKVPSQAGNRTNSELFHIQDITKVNILSHDQHALRVVCRVVPVAERRKNSQHESEFYALVNRTADGLSEARRVDPCDVFFAPQYRDDLSCGSKNRLKVWRNICESAIRDYSPVSLSQRTGQKGHISTISPAWHISIDDLIPPIASDRAHSTRSENSTRSLATLNTASPVLLQHGGSLDVSSERAATQQSPIPASSDRLTDSESLGGLKRMLDISDFSAFDAAKAIAELEEHWPGLKSFPGLTNDSIFLLHWVLRETKTSVEWCKLKVLLLAWAQNSFMPGDNSDVAVRKQRLQNVLMVLNS
ncbi:hypothetical protein BT63DRAFT_460227 [Microthyrium microscopicum]|uniref:Uncharacterized protein n=1 Tax=Microthyrium microscopicum TaxID=703497 RepID=A0A6A6U1B9_9PEZI|nr:hypothetical protein BT63DRAFT_460227 [Microthyrium microscopicum]